MFKNYKINKTHNVKKTCSNVTNDVVIKKHNTINTNDTYNIMKIIIDLILLIIIIILKRTSIQVRSPTILQDITITTVSIM